MVSKSKDMQKHKLNIFPLMLPDDYNRLKDDLAANGYDPKNPIYTYQCDILDGWNRYRACGELNIQPMYREFTGTDEQAFGFVLRTNKRRNLTPSQWAVIAVESYEVFEVIREDVDKKRKENISKSMANNDNAIDKNKTSEVIPPSVKHHGKIEIDNEPNESVDQKGAEIKPVTTSTQKQMVQLIVPSVKDTSRLSNQILAETFNTNRTYIADARKLQKDKPEVLEQVKRGELTIPETKKPHVSNNSGENQWYTPEHIIEAARTTMGRIDVDPASSHIANTTVKANTYYTESNNGLTKEWNGNVWMNPPYAQPLISQFVEKLIEKFLSGEVKKACVLVNNATDTTWFHSIVRISSAICFTKGRVRFIDMNGNPGAPLQGQAIIYIGKTDAYKFCQSFSEIGFVLKNQ